jgi:ATP-binding cassette subfamily F protein 3
MLNINNISFYFGSRALYENASLHIKPKERIALIGANGTGKSTLLRLINGEFSLDGGEMSKGKECTIGFLNQDLLSYQSQNSILEVALEAFTRQNELHQEIEDVLHQMEVNYEDKLVKKLANLQEEFEALDGYNLEIKAKTVLEGLGFSTADLSRPLQEFSGGWRMRVMLAKLLLQKPALLMLDEPTNHLDLPSIEWMETYLSSYEGTVLVVSHDQEFLNKMANVTVEVWGKKLVRYSGNYDFYVQEKALRKELQGKSYENQQQKIKETERFIERFRSKASKSKQVQSRVKSLEKLEMIEAVESDSASMSFSFDFGQQSGKNVMELTNFSKAYNDVHVLKNARADIQRGDKIALIGANGVGKSTLLRIIAGTEFMDGERTEGHNVLMSFYAQHQLEDLNLEADILEELQQSGSGKLENELRSILGCFLFTGDDVFKKIKVLSGGEKSRVALAKTLISEANFLLLDEPTNHLDIQAVNILVQALQQYKGTYIMVSHNRHFVSQIANKIWYIEDKEIKVYPGTYAEYQIWKSKQDAQKSPKIEKKVEVAKKVKNQQKNASQYKEEQKKLRKLEKELESAEQKIENLEKELQTLEEELAKPSVYSDVNLLAKTNQKYEQTKQNLKKHNEEWEIVALKIEEFEG